MAELATIARPYAEALFKAAGAADPAALAAQVQSLAAAAANPLVRQFAEHPKVSAEQVFDVVTAALNEPLTNSAANLLRVVVDNGRLAALPEIAAQFQALVNARGGVSQATIYSAYPIDAGQLGEVVALLEKRFGRKLDASVVPEPALIGGIRVVVGDEVLDTSIRARLEHMRMALAA